MIRCLVVDDEPHAIELLTSYISKVPSMDLEFSTTDPIEALHYVQYHKPGLIFLDIHMPELDGMQFLKLLAGRSKVILTTAYAEYALEGYEHDIVDYLLKPILLERFLKAVQKAMHLLETPSVEQPVSGKNTSSEEDFIFVKTETRNKIIQIQLADIEYIEGLGNYVSFYTSTARIVTLLTMKELEERLPTTKFIRIHHSYVVPVHKITQVEGNRLHIGTHKLPIGETYKKAFLLMLESRILKSKKQ
ncbi:response regulator transcription factor [Rhodocytophaga rosea]|uniref:Response regulator transcription factor n=1 Tax=Rhodocytophaga rosea TaxID=2704465 RepID=A0A6C0GMU1_9BACT|nr:LytTR family DNA-binding domain-containing protein [Rhodocytophaga rosea]QHT68950.1 response regulator transcription factor [Rhodocytophaga rosea]